MSASTPAVGAPVATASSTEAPGFVRRLVRRPVAVACLGYLLVLVVVAIVAPIALPDVASEHAGDLLATRQGPSAAHPLGTDTVGRDVLERLLVGTRVTLLGVLEALVVVLVLGVPFGLAAGFFGGWLDRVVSWLADLTFSVPGIVIVLVVLSVIPQSMLAAMCTVGVLMAPGLMRVVRAATLPVRQELYIAAAQVSGLSRPYIIVRHVLPRIAGAVIVQASLLAAVVLLVQSSLAFLRLVVAEPAPSWGGMVADGVSALELQPWLIWPPGLAIALTILALGLLGDAVRDATTETWSTPTRRVRRERTKRRMPPLRRAARMQRGDGPSGTRLAAPLAAGARPLLSVEGLTVSFPTSAGPVRVLEDATFDVGVGETVGLVGESGCGKTVTAMAILGMLPAAGQIESGRIAFEGRDLTALGERELHAVRGREIGLVSQEPMISLDPAFRIGWQLAECLRRHHGISRRAASGRAVELLRMVRMPNAEAVARRYPHELSGGMAQRVAIARALAGEPKLLIADEPTTALDVTVQAEILELLRDLQRERNMALVLVTHDWGVVADICSRAVVMYAGQVVERAELVPMFRQPLHPYTEGLFASNPHNAGDVEVLPAIPGSVPQPGAWPAGCHFRPRCGYATEACGERPIPLEQPAPGRETRCIHHDRLAAS